MYCPQCRSGFQTGFTRCGDCDIDLVDALPPLPIEGDGTQLPRTDTSDYVAVATVQGQLQANQVRSFLESNGIPTEIQGETSRNVYGLTVDGLAAVEVLVPKQQAAAASDLLVQADHGDLMIGSTDEEN